MNKHKWLVSLLFLLITSLACQLPVSALNPAYTPPASTAPSSQVSSNLDAASANPGNSNEITVTITSSQLTSLLLEQLAQQTDFSFQNVGVQIQNNQIEISGNVQKGAFSTNAKVTLIASIDAAGQLQVMVKSVDLGLLPLPAGYVEGLQTSINTSVNDYLRPTLTGYRLTSVDLSNGAVTLKAAGI